MKLYILNCGQMITPENNILSDFNTEMLRLVLPVPVYLIEHPTKGLVLIDTGFNYEHLSEEMKMGMAWSPILQIKNQISSLGYECSDVKYVLLSHLHFDHAGQIADFPNAEFYIRKNEIIYAQSSDRPDYIKEDFAGIVDFNVNYIPEDVDYDLFGDGSIVCIDTKGHSAGHQSFIISLPHTGKVLLAVDAAHLPAYLETIKYFDDSYNKELCIKSVERIKEVSRSCEITILGHDPSMWSRIKKAPEFLD